MRSVTFSGKTSTCPLVADFRDPNPTLELITIGENSPESLWDLSRQPNGESKFPDNQYDDNPEGSELKRSRATPRERV